MGVLFDTLSMLFIKAVKQLGQFIEAAGPIY